MADPRRKLPADVPIEFLELLKRPVNFHPALARLCGNTVAGLMLSQAIYWSTTEAAQKREGWFYKSWREWQEETCLTRREQDAAKIILRSKNFVLMERRKVDGAPTLHFRVNFRAILEALQNAPFGAMDCTDTCNGMHEPGQSWNAPLGAIDCTERGNPIRKQETTAETTRDYKQGKQSPAMIIAAERFWKEFAASAPAAGLYVPNADLNDFYRFQKAASRVGLTFDQAKELLRRDPYWKSWDYIERLERDLDEVFPEEQKDEKRA